MSRQSRRGARVLRLPGAVAGSLAGLLLACALAAPAAAQPADTARTREVVLLFADSLAGETVGGERVQRLFGNVALRQDSTWLWADRVVRYLDRNEIAFTGNVRIVDRGDTLWADRVLYDRQTRIGRARGDVRLSDGDVLVTAPSGVYDTQAKHAVFDEGVTLVDSAATLESRTGAYWTDEKRAEFAGDVHLRETRTYLEADSVTYFRETEVSIARGNVVIERLGDVEDDDEPTDTTTIAADTTMAGAAGTSEGDTSLRTLLFGRRAYNDNRAGYSRIEGDPLLVQLRTDTSAARPPAAPDTLALGGVDSLRTVRADTLAPPEAGGEVDTLLVRAVVLEVTRIDSLQRLVAVDSVRIWQRDLAAVADSLVYDRIRVEDAEPEEEARLFGSPVAWFEETQASGDTIRVKARGGAVDTLFVRGNAFVAQRDTSIERIQQLRGQHLTAVFRDDTLRTLTIGPNAEAIHFRADDEGRPDGAVQASSDQITFLFRGGEIARMSAVGKPEGTIYDEAQLPDPFQLDGYRWLPERRPAREGLLDGRVVPPPAAPGPPEDVPAAEPPAPEREEGPDAPPR